MTRVTTPVSLQKQMFLKQLLAKILWGIGA